MAALARTDALALVREACASASSAEELAPLRVLGISEPALALARAGAAGAPGAEPTAARLRAAGYVTAGEPGALAALPPGSNAADAEGRARVAASVAPAVGAKLVLADGLLLAAFAHPEVVVARLPGPAQLTQSAQTREGAEVEFDPLWLAEPDDAAAPWPLESVARWRGPNVLEIPVHPWAGPAGELSDDTRAALLGRVLSGAMARRPDPAEPADLSELPLAVALLDLARSLAWASPARALAAAEAGVEATRDEVRHARTALVAALQRQRDLVADRDRIAAGDGRLARGRMLAIVDQLERTARLPFVAHVAPGEGGTSIEVTTHPLVLSDEEGARLIGALAFSLDWVHGTLRFRGGGAPPHPHVYDSGRPCLGTAAQPILGPLADLDLEVATFHVGAFLLTVKRGDTVRRLASFAPTTLPFGWHPPPDATGSIPAAPTGGGGR